MFILLKRYIIKRLQDMTCLKKEFKNNNLVKIAILKEFFNEIRFIIVKQ